MGNNKSWLITLSVLVALVILGGIGLYALQINQAMGLRRDVNAAIGQLSQQLVDLKVKEIPGSTDPGTGTGTISDTIDVPDGFRSYTNENLGFSLNVSLQVKGTGKQSDSLEIIESGNVVYLTYKSNYYYAETLKRSKSSLSDIEKTKGIPWGIMVRTVNSEQELTTLIKNRYGSGCSIGSQEQVGDTGTYRVMIKGDGLGMDKTKCPINYVTAVKYSPNLKKAAIWDIGQDVSFVKLVNDEIIPLDEEMVNSFIFIK